MILTDGGGGGGFGARGYVIIKRNFLVFFFKLGPAN